MHLYIYTKNIYMTGTINIDYMPTQPWAIDYYFVLGFYYSKLQTGLNGLKYKT